MEGATPPAIMCCGFARRELGERWGGGALGVTREHDQKTFFFLPLKNVTRHRRDAR